MNNSQNTKQNLTQKTVAIIGAGAGGLMAADFLAEYNVNVDFMGRQNRFKHYP